MLYEVITDTDAFKIKPCYIVFISCREIAILFTQSEKKTFALFMNYFSMVYDLGTVVIGVILFFDNGKYQGTGRALGAERFKSLGRKGCRSIEIFIIKTGIV